MSAVHRLFRGHWPTWCATGYDFLTLHWTCTTCTARRGTVSE